MWLGIKEREYKLSTEDWAIRVAQRNRCGVRVAVMGRDIVNKRVVNIMVCENLR